MKGINSYFYGTPSVNQRTLYRSEPFIFTSLGPNFYGALNFNITGYKHKQAKHLA